MKGKELSYGEVIEKWFGAGGEVLGHGAVRRAEGFAKMPPFYEIGCSGLELTVDRETGQVHITKLTTVGDVGFAINPALVHGQDAGAAMMGMGAALHEELVYDGEQLANPERRRLPRAALQRSPRPGDPSARRAPRRIGPVRREGRGRGGGEHHRQLGRVRARTTLRRVPAPAPDDAGARVASDARGGGTERVGALTARSRAIQAGRNSPMRDGTPFFCSSAS